LLFGRSDRLIFHDHYGDIAIDQKPTYKLKGLFKPHFYIGVSSELTEWATKKLKMNETSIFLLENTVIPTSDHSDRYSGDWVMVSNLRPTKNILFAISMAEKMKRTLVVFGNHDGSSYADEVIRVANNSEHVRIVSNEADIQQYLGNFKLGIHTALSETGPLVLLEYMAQGLPFITSDTGEVVNRIREELPSFIVSTFDEKEWKKRIKSLDNEIMVNGPALKQKLQYLFNEKFSPQRYLDQCLKIYQRVLTY
jgi:glycosyltransferase involved in cell wall biosynthesis